MPGVFVLFNLPWYIASFIEIPWSKATETPDTMTDFSEYFPSMLNSFNRDFEFSALVVLLNFSLGFAS